MRTRFTAFMAGAIAAVSVATSVTAQTPLGPADVIRGRVSNDSGRAIVATVIVTRGPDRLVQQTTSDSSGNYRVRFEQGTGDYLVYVSASGYRAARRRVQRQHDERELVANFVLAVDVTQLAAVKTTANRPARANDPVGPMQPETGSSERWADGVSGQVSPLIAGDIASTASTMSNVTISGGGVSILGSDPSSTQTTLNGMATGATTMPRAARTDVRVTGATYDATRGGFSGANIDVRLAPGNRDYQERNAYFTINPTAWQFTDPTSRALGATTSTMRGSAAADGELIRDALTYNVSVDVGRSISSPQTLLDADADALLREGASPDSVARIVSIAGPLGVPLSGPGVPGLRQHTSTTWLGRFDDTRDSLDRQTLTTYLGYVNDGALGFGALAAPSASATRTQRTLGAQYFLDKYVGEGRRILNETRASISGSHTELSPYRQLPTAQILLRSADSAAAQDFTPITLGGMASLSTTNGNWIGEAANETIWNADGRRHHFEALAWGRMDGVHLAGGGNPLGSYVFNSIADFAANRPAAFTRTLDQPSTSGEVWNSALAFSHQFAPTRYFSVIEGARLEADGFVGAPAVDPALDAALGTHSGAAPMRVHVSPRVGFTYTYNHEKGNGNGMWMNPAGTFFRNMTGTLRGGVGEFRDLLQPTLLANAAAATGLPGGATALSCVGGAVPTPDWTRFETNPASIPSGCVGSSGILAESAPNVTLIDPSYDVPRSWRASLDWSTNLGRWLVQANTMASYNLNQPGIVNENFTGVPKFTLASEGNRPVFVSTGAIDPSSGVVSAAESRRASAFGSVNDRVSDLRGEGEQITFRVQPDLQGFRSRFPVFTSASYTLQSSRRQFRGFDGAGFGDPRTREWAPSNFDARHVFVFSAGTWFPTVGSITLFSRLQSGLPFTPEVAGDVNGDGIGNDRAFIPNPATEPDANLAAQLRALLTSGSGTAKSCIAANLGVVAQRNGCRGPWTQSLNAQWSPRLPFHWSSRVTPTVYLDNVLAGVDELLHGSDNLRGWGTPAAIDPVLLVPRGFDAASQRFQYDVNSRFADARAGHTSLINPFRLVIDVSVNLTTNPDLQQLRRAVEPVKTPKGWSRRTPEALETFYLRQTSSIHKLILEQSDSLFLSNQQIVALRRADSVFSERVRAIYGPLGEYLAHGNGDAGKAELDSVTASQKAYWKVFWEQPEIADSILTPAQRTLMPILVTMLGVPQPNRENSRFVFGHPVTANDRRPNARGAK